jgi:hypothetical protein
MPKKCRRKGCPRPARKAGWCSAHYERVRKNGHPGSAKIGVATYNRQLLPLLLEAIKEETDECIIFGINGYRTMKVDGHITRAHVVVCEMTHGPCPKGLQAAHECGNNRCVNPRHISWKTPPDNHADKILHGTSGKGEANPAAKFTKNDIRDIRTRAAAGEPHQQIADDYNTHRVYISQIYRRKVWKHIE